MGRTNQSKWDSQYHLPQSLEEVALYARLNFGAGDLLQFYRSGGFEVASIPWRDPAHIRSDQMALWQEERQTSEEALAQFDRLSKPVLLHCSAGIDRSAPVAAFIKEKRSENVV